MDRSAIIIAVGSNEGFGEDKGLMKLENKPLLRHVIDVVAGVVDEVIIVTDSRQRADLYGKIVPSKVKVSVVVCDVTANLDGVLTGFEAAKGDYSLLLPFDSPFVSREVVSLLFELCVGKSATVPRWPSNQVESLHAVYNTKQALDAVKDALAHDVLNMSEVVSRMRGVRFISTMVLEQLDPDLRTFFNINTPLDFKKATAIYKHGKMKKLSKRK